MQATRAQLCAILLAAATALGAARALADMPAARIVPLLTPPSRIASRAASPLADEEGRIPLLLQLPAGVDARARGLLPVAPGLGAIHLPAEDVPAFALAHADARVRVAPRRHPLIDYSGKWTKVPEFRSQTGLDGSGVVVGVIDTGLDVAHADFRDANGKSRVAWYLAREAARGFHPALEAQYGCTDPNQSPCAIYAAADLDELIASGAAPRDPIGHGTHVTSIAAGNGGVSLDPMPRYLGMAPGAVIIMASPSTEGFSDGDILNAARFIFDRADELGLPAVVNVSLGSDFGPHDGTSALEWGLAELVGDDEPGHILVVAAGNSGEVYPTNSPSGPYGIHTEVEVSPHGITRVPIVNPGAGGFSHGAGFVWLTFDPGDEVQVGLDGPDDVGISLVAPGDDRGYHDDDIRAGVVNNVTGTTSNIPADSNSAVVSWSGRWRADSPIALRLSGTGHAKMWLSTTGGAGNGLGLVFERARKTSTIAVPASHPELIAVGCTTNRAAWYYVGGGIVALDVEQDSVCSFSGAGPTATGVMKPDLLAPGQFVVGAMSAEADPRKVFGSIFDVAGCESDKPYCALTDATHVVTSGTSMSAPHVAGAIALMLQKDKTLTQRQVMQLLQGSVARPTGHVPFEPQAGPGRLDMQSALSLLGEQQLASEASVEKSWFVLASDYLRPDPAHTLVGVIELRDAAGVVVTTVPEGALALVVAGGLVTEPIVRVAPGLWRFGIAAAKGTGGGRVELDVRYGARSLGRRSLPIATDPWRIGGGVNPVGGCAMSSAAALDGSPLLALALLPLCRFRRSSGERRRAARRSAAAERA